MMPSMPELDDLLNDMPLENRERFAEIVALTDAFCHRHLNDEYKAMCRLMTFSMSQEGSPIRRGKAASWACGVAYAVGRVNFLTDPSQSPHMKSEEIAAGFEVSMATMQAKSRVIHDGLHLTPLDPDFTIASRLDDNPLVWMVEVNGFLIDMRAAPREAQVIAVEKGLIPYVHADRQAPH